MRKLRRSSLPTLSKCLASTRAQQAERMAPMIHEPPGLQQKIGGISPFGRSTGQCAKLATTLLRRLTFTLKSSLNVRTSTFDALADHTEADRYLNGPSISLPTGPCRISSRISLPTQPTRQAPAALVHISSAVQFVSIFFESTQDELKALGKGAFCGPSIPIWSTKLDLGHLNDSEDFKFRSSGVACRYYDKKGVQCPEHSIPTASGIFSRPFSSGHNAYPYLLFEYRYTLLRSSIASHISAQQRPTGTLPYQTSVSQDVFSTHTHLPAPLGRCLTDQTTSYQSYASNPMSLNFSLIGHLVDKMDPSTLRVALARTSPSGKRPSAVLPPNHRSLGASVYGGIILGESGG
ncbi:hypothetical protein D9756_011207 [Leucocoprinus leucothites]|uniref:Uncharacterized protein n=1 Tax=Leucocoprinus leucothites TaxID=201217 RepID=A0A8H5CPZ3_9AGAR|nr:hypothetical protein D9756_011207 [Leucoagaricus leucothites]